MKGGMVSEEEENAGGTMMKKEDKMPGSKGQVGWLRSGLC